MEFGMNLVPKQLVLCRLLVFETSRIPTKMSCRLQALRPNKSPPSNTSGNVPRFLAGKRWHTDMRTRNMMGECRCEHLDLWNLGWITNRDNFGCPHQHWVSRVHRASQIWFSLTCLPFGYVKYISAIYKYRYKENKEFCSEIGISSVYHPMIPRGCQSWDDCSTGVSMVANLNKSSIHQSGQITIIPKPELFRPFWVGFLYYSLPFGVTTRRE